MERGLCRAEANRRFSSFECASDWEDHIVCEIIHVGIPRAPEDFLREAVSKGHPRNLIARIPEAVRDAIENLLHQPLHKRLDRRAQFFRKWLKRSLELKSQEEDLHAQMPLHFRRVLKGKKLLLWREILVDLQYKDVGVIDDVIKGFSLTGWAPKTGVFERWVRKPEYSLDHLKLAPALNAAVTGALTSATDGEHDQFVWDETQKEVEHGWFYPAEHCKPECIAKRFPLRQANKVRLIDDFSINGVNAAYGLREKLRVQSIDELCSYLAYILDHCEDPVALDLVGRTFEFGVDPYHHDLSTEDSSA